MASLGVPELSEFADRCLRQLQGVLTALDWSLPGDTGESDSCSHEVERILCPYDANHQVPKAVLEKHVASCKLRQLGYSKEETELLGDSSFFYGKTQISTSVIDQALQTQIIRRARESASHETGSEYNKSSYSSVPVEVPQNHKHAVCDLTPADRLAIYDYALEEIKKQRSNAQLTGNDSDLFEDLAAKVNQDDDQKGPKSHLEILAEMRDYKRRRQSYRAKNVHITKKSYTEVIREVISVHMEELVTHWRGGPDTQEGTSHFTSSRSARKEARRSASVDSRHSAGSHRETDYSKHRREHSRSPHKRKRSRSTDRDSRRKRKRDEERRHGNKRK